MDSETLLRAAKILAPIVGAGLLAIAGAWGNEEVQATSLVVTESKAGAANAEAATFGAYDDYREYIMAVEVMKAECDTSLEGFARHRDDERDWEHVLEACHSRGVID